MYNSKKPRSRNGGNRGAARPSLFDQGYQAGYRKGRAAGYEDFEKRFEGTSIIIPTFNKKQLLLQCLDSIEAYTSFPYEVIVVDDASSDGTTDALRSRRRIRLSVHAENRGFAASVNTGLMMAKGHTVLVLNNDVLVTENWLSNMLDCLNSAPDIGAVGPVTNYIGSEQQIEVPYQEIAEMWGFAAAYNRKDPQRWRRTDRLAGFCLLMRRETVMRTGYFDEGYRVGNYEDDDWMIRLRLQGLKLMIAGDTFIHHFGSQTMNSLDQRDLSAINRENRDYFHQKWGSVYERPEQLEGLEAAADFRPESCPVQVLVSSGTGTIYWLEQGQRFRIKEADAAVLAAELSALCIVRLSQFTLRGIPLGGEWDLPEAKLALAKVWSTTDQLDEGSVMKLPDGPWYQLDRGAVRRFWTPHTAEAWGLAHRARSVSPEVCAAYPEGPPVLPPTRLRSPQL